MFKKPTKLEDLATKAIKKGMPKPEPRVQEVTSDDEESSDEEEM
jgi:hypothetical protein